MAIRQQLAHIWLTLPARLRGTALAQMRYSLTLRITLSAKIRRCAMVCVWTVSSLPDSGDRTMSLAPTSVNMSRTRKPSSVTTWSPGSSRPRIPEILVSSLSEMEPACSFETKVMAPFGATPMSALKVVVFL